MKRLCTLLPIFLVIVGLSAGNAQELPPGGSGKAAEAATPAPLRLSVEDAVARALRTDEGLAAGRNRVEALDAGSAAAKAARFPEIVAEGRYARVEEHQPLSVQTGDGELTIGESFDDATALELSLLQPVFLGGRLRARVEGSRALRRAESLEQLRRQSTVALQVQRSYWHLVWATERRDAFMERHNQVRANLRSMEDRFDEGLVTRNQLLTVEMRLAQAELDLVEARNEVALAMADLAVRIGEEPHRNIVTSSRIPERRKTLPTLAQLVETGLRERSDIQALRDRIAAKTRDVTIARSRLYPELYVAGSYRYARPNEALFPPPDGFEDSWQIGAVGRISLGSVPRVLHQTTQAFAEVEAHRHSLVAAEDQLKLEIQRAYLSWQASGQRVTLGQTMVRQAEENLSNTIVRVHNGTALNEDLLDAQVDLLEARLALTSATVDRELAWLGLRHASGMEL